MTEQQYNEALSHTHIPSGPDWNERYLTALEENGLQLVPWTSDEFPSSYYLEAPLPVPNQEPSWGRSMIMPQS